MISLLDIPKRWNALPIDDLFEIVGGIPAPQDDASYSENGIPFVRMKDVGREHLTRSLQLTDDKLSADLVAQKKWKPIPVGSILMPRSGSVGLNHRALLTRPAIIVSHVCALVPKDERIWAPFAYYASCQLDMRKLTKKTTGLDSLNFGDLKRVLFPLPPLDEQKRIAAILDQADELRRKRQRAIDRLNQLGQAIFHEMFGDPVAPSNRLASRLIDIAELINGDRSSNYPSGTDIKDEGILFLNTTNIRDGELDFTKAQFITEAKFRSLSRGKLQRGDLVITLRGTLGQCAIFDCQYETGFINAQMMIIRTKATVLPRFLREYISFPSVQAKLKGANSGSAVPQLTATQMKDMQILLPALDDQRRFVEAVDTARSVQNEIVAHANWLNGLFASLQHRAFQGEL